MKNNDTPQNGRGQIRIAKLWGVRRQMMGKQAGQSALEFAITLSILLMLTFGLIDIGRMVYTASVVQAAAQEGARAGLIDMSEIVPAIQQKVVGLDENRMQIDISQPDSNSVEVGVTYKFEFIVPLIAQTVNAQGFDLRGSASMIIR